MIKSQKLMDQLRIMALKFKAYSFYPATKDVDDNKFSVTVHVQDAYEGVMRFGEILKSANTWNEIRYDGASARTYTLSLAEWPWQHFTRCAACHCLEGPKFCTSRRINEVKESCPIYTCDADGELNKQPEMRPWPEMETYWVDDDALSVTDKVTLFQVAKDLSVGVPAYEIPGLGISNSTTYAAMIRLFLDQYPYRGEYEDYKCWMKK